MPLPLTKLLQDHPEPVCVRQNQKVSDALALMIANDYTQLPVIDANDHLLGLISERSIVETYFHERASVSLLDLSVDHCQTRAITLPPEADLFEALDRLREVYAIVVVKDGRPFRMLTDYDTTHYFRDVSEGSIIIEDIEVTLRKYAEAAFPNEKAMDAALIRAFGADKKDPTRPSRQYDRLSFYDHLQLIRTEENWGKFQETLHPKELFSSLMEQVREIRNQLAHYRDDLDPVQRNALLRARDWLSSRPKPPMSQVSDAELVRVTPADTAALAGSGRYAALTSFLERQASRSRSVTISFNDLEALIGVPLPKTATEHQIWWENELSSAQALAWLSAGFQVSDVEFSSRQVTFRYTAYALMQVIFADWLEELKRTRPSITRVSKTFAQGWLTIAGGKTGFSINWVLSANSDLFRMEVYIDTGDREINKRAFDKLHAQKQAIEQELGEPLRWNRLDDKRASRIFAARELGIEQAMQERGKVRSEIINLTLRFVDALQPRIKKLDLDTES